MGIIEYMLGLYRDDGKENGNYVGFRDSGCIGIMEKKMETT